MIKISSAGNNRYTHIDNNDKRDNFDNKKKKEKKTLFNGKGGREKKKEREKLIFPKCDPTKFHRLKHCPLYYHVL